MNKDINPEERDQYTHEDIICSAFGCGKKLSLQERLCGGRCINHQPGKQFDYGTLFPDNGIVLEEIEMRETSDQIEYYINHELKAVPADSLPRIMFMELKKRIRTR